jgi:phosphatidylglycerophosphatase A
LSNGDTDPATTATSKLILLLARGLGTGYSPLAPGTVGSVLGLGWALAVAAIPGPIWVPLLVTLLAAAAAVPVCTRACRLLGDKDPGQVVLDEIVAVPLVFGCGLLPMDPPSLLGGFLLFRLFDIVKPPPARQFERLPEGTGIVADDLAAAVYAGLVLWGGQQAFTRLAVAGDLLPQTPFG